MKSQPMTTAVSAVMTSAVSAVMTSAVTVTTGLVTPLPNVVSHAEKPEKFNGVNFKQWQQKMFFYLTTLNLARFLTEPKPHVDEGDLDTQTVSAMHAWNHSDFLCRNFILNGLVDTLYNVYCKAKTAKELWGSLDRKYKTEDAGTKKFVVAKFLDFKMIDSKTVMSQVAAMIEKLPPSWVDFKNYLKHKRKEMTIEYLVVRLRIEEDNKVALKKVDGPEIVKANLVEHGNLRRQKTVESAERKVMGNAPTLVLRGELGKRSSLELVTIVKSKTTGLANASFPRRRKMLNK
ncbi:hypothetical protein HanRHA438_Chr12g0544561 [Helianthus annuus]|nr:hypothetical protein HanRHA438_Chr12g0544561 [Helianthus annuus]